MKASAATGKDDGQSQSAAIEIKRNGIAVRIRPTPKNGKTFFVLDYRVKGQRRLVWRSTLAAAKKAAAEVFDKIAEGQAEALLLTGDDRMMFLRARDALAGIDKRIDDACREYAEAVVLLPAGTSLIEAAKLCRARNLEIVEKRTVPEVVTEMLAVKRAANLSAVHLKDLESRLNRFSADFNLPITELSARTIQAWLDKLGLQPRSKRNFMLVLRNLFGFAIARKYLAKDAIDEVKAVQLPKDNGGEIEVFTPAELREVLAAARPEMVPFLVIGAFAGLRSAEIERLDWQSVNLTERHIEIKAGQAKTGSRRLAPITDNLAAWLTPYAKPSGKVLRYDSWWNQIPKVTEAVNQRRGKPAKPFVWKHNALRHSFCSYRIAAIKNAAQVALEAGNSPKMIFQHYRELVTEKQAQEWFGILPPAKPAVHCRTARRRAAVSSARPAIEIAPVGIDRAAHTPVAVQSVP